MSIGRRIFLGFMGVLLLTVLVAGSGIYILSVARESYRTFIDVDQQLVIGAWELRSASLRQSDSYRGYLMYAEEDYLTTWEEAGTEFEAAMQKMVELANTQDKDTLANVESMQRDWKKSQKTLIDLRRTGTYEEALAASRESTQLLREQIANILRPFVEAHTAALVQAREDLTRYVNTIQNTMIALAVAAIALGLVSAFWVTRLITVQLREAINQLSTSTAEITAMTAQVASGAAETATAVSETTTTVEEVKQTAQVSSQKAKLVSDTAQRAVQVAQGGRGAVEQTVQGMARIREQMEAIAGVVVRLSEQSQAIGEIIAMVNDLAEQSNLLAVNAAIEAARAGEQGKGFGVVAQEVKNLAEQSKQATAQVRSILGDIQKATSAAVLATEQGSRAVESGTKQAGEAGQAIRQLSDSITEAAQAATQIAASNQQQLVGMDQVALAMENINQASAQNVAGTKQSETAAHNLTTLAARLRRLLEPRTPEAAHG
ncbi:MAG: CHASE3 domain-containing protein [Candidatus Hydrogenedentes bacterium]|nr:CHASE3 domain-containing protein [Candidatus Hydrogenedentota bacterium]